MPSAMVSTAVMVNAGCLRSVRMAKPRSLEIIGGRDGLEWRTRDTGGETREARLAQARAVPARATAKLFLPLTLRVCWRSVIGRRWEAVFESGQRRADGIAISGFRA